MERKVTRLRPANFRTAAELEEQYKAESHRCHQEDILRSMVRGYPPSSEECDIMISGIRLARFVGEWECENCGLDCQDHTLGWMFNTKICIKDFAAKCKRLGIKIRVVNN
jgi:hypothetical protein